MNALKRKNPDIFNGLTSVMINYIFNAFFLHQLVKNEMILTFFKSPYIYPETIPRSYRYLWITKQLSIWSGNCLRINVPQFKINDNLVEVMKDESNLHSGLTQVLMFINKYRTIFHYISSERMSKIDWKKIFSETTHKIIRMLLYFI